MRTTSVSLAVTILAFAQVLPAKAQERIPIFVRTAESTSGFTDPSKHRQDSVKDLVKRLKDSKALRVVESETDAVILLEVLGRETRRVTNLMGKQNKSYVTVRISAGDFSAEWEGESGSKGMMSGYGSAAGRIVNQVEAWVETNWESLLVLLPDSSAASRDSIPPARRR